MRSPDMLGHPDVLAKNETVINGVLCYQTYDDVWHEYTPKQLTHIICELKKIRPTLLPADKSGMDTAPEVIPSK